MIIRPEANLSQNKNFYLLELFEPETKKTNYYFVFSSSRRVETDKVGALIWKSLPSRVEELAKKIEPIISKIIEDNKSRWNEKIEIEKSLELLKDNYREKIQEKRLIINREAESNKNFNHDLLNLVKASFSTYLYVLYKAGLILVDGKSALSSDEKELVEVNFEEFSYGSEKLAGSQREVFSSREIILDRSDKDLFLISAVVITYNGEKYIYDCLKSLSEQTWPQLEIIVVDNASQDKTCEIIKNNFPQIQLFRFSRNRHFARAVNFGLKKAKGKAILILNQDVVL
ncbi:MAG: glycosyltransferase, partial [Candidatus Aminicenantes bacterium]|nr:glycosyltransferase [Candidatus Aminicenantes bacterium]